MYIPNQSQLNPLKQNVRPRRRRTNRRRNVYSMGGALLLLAALLLIAAQQHHGTDVGGNSDADNLLHDFEQLWSWSDHVLAGGAEQSVWTIRWDMSGLSSADQETLIRNLFQDSKGNPLDKLVKNNGSTILSEPNSSLGLMGSITLQVTEETETGAALYVLFESQEEEKVSRQAFAQMSEQIASTPE